MIDLRTDLLDTARALVAPALASHDGAALKIATDTIDELGRVGALPLKPPLPQKSGGCLRNDGARIPSHTK